MRLQFVQMDAHIASVNGVECIAKLITYNDMSISKHRSRIHIHVYICSAQINPYRRGNNTNNKSFNVNQFKQKPFTEINTFIRRICHHGKFLCWIFLLPHFKSNATGKLMVLIIMRYAIEKTFNRFAKKNPIAFGRRK